MSKLTDYADKIVEKYANFLTKNPFIIFGITFLFIISALYFAGNVQQSTFEPQDSIPDDIPVIAAFQRFSDDFGSITSVMIVLEIEPENIQSNELRDIRDIAVIDYFSLIKQELSRSRNIESIDTPNDYLAYIGNPRSSQELQNAINDNPAFWRFFSNDANMARIIINLYDNYDQDELIKELEDAISFTPKIPGVTKNIAGNVIAQTLVMREIGPDMAKTSNISLAGIIIILIIIFGSIKYAFLPLTTIIIGVLWTFGFLGFIGTSINSATSGVLSMIIGIGIDFGIQIISRYRQELRKKKTIENAMNISLNKTIFPMFITTIAAIIGFTSMSLGQLTVLKEIGDMMTYGVIFCYLAAITFVPSIILIIEYILNGYKNTLNIYRSNRSK
ncbi:MAG: MMPL family transporter [Candidatus Woesearchaeota archaeon]